MLAVDEHALLIKLIQEAPSSRKEFHVLDIGAGNFGWAKGMADFVDQRTDLPEGITVHIYGIRGERAPEFTVLKGRRSVLHGLGEFPVEDLGLEFKRRGLDLAGQLDLIISRWTFAHLTDPVGTFVQAYNLLRPGTGVLIMDSFRLLYESHPTRSGKTGPLGYARQMVDFLGQVQAPLLVRDTGEGVANYQFMVKRSGEAPASIPMDYLQTVEVETRSAHFARGSTHIVRYRRHFKPLKDGEFNWPHGAWTFYGDLGLFQWLPIDHALMEWRPFLKRPLTAKEQAYLEERAAKAEEARKASTALALAAGPDYAKMAVRAMAKFEDFQKVITDHWSRIDEEDRDKLFRRTMGIYKRDPRYFDLMLKAGADCNHRMEGGGHAPARAGSHGQAPGDQRTYSAGTGRHPAGLRREPGHRGSPGHDPLAGGEATAQPGTVRTHESPWRRCPAHGQDRPARGTQGLFHRRRRRSLGLPGRAKQPDSLGGYALPGRSRPGNAWR